MLPNDYSRCADHAQCPRADDCARTEWPADDSAFWIAQTPFFAASAGGQCQYFIAIDAARRDGGEGA